jgi:hypothetical protein
MGAPYYQIKDMLRREGIVAFSSDYALSHEIRSAAGEDRARAGRHGVPGSGGTCTAQAVDLL